MGFLAVGPEILDRLEQVLGDTARVRDRASPQDVRDLPGGGAGVVVVYDGGRVCESRPDGRAVRLEQRWRVVVGARNVARPRSGAPARAEAGALVDRVLAALLGWRPPSAARPLTLVELPEPAHQAGLQRIPLTFTTDILRSAP
ncbi:phage tail terminator protein [Marichromatium gracile]|uniref:Uncharacterized protein n=1 Tax=Marichromatium gracile TaxID=1048 RepID=A0A4R4ABA8_MARGR|nr:hypothetical protein [Marichromatium gracile]MBK1710579.1 hypothetical protein [Marichromatium gracile]MBO8085767.1 hypothetical protein [Marichromatium sp.]TCW36292.1 hypothetical protein EDC29_10475 [Marichromatium gracile]